MPYQPPHSFNERLDRLKCDLADASDDRVRPLFRFSLASFLVVSTALGAAIGWLGRLELLLPVTTIAGATLSSSLVGGVCGLLTYWVWRRYGFKFRRAASETPSACDPDQSQEIGPPS